GDGVTNDTGVLDVRAHPDDPPEDGFQLVTPEYTVPPNSDKMFCFFGTYEGPDVGVNFYQWFQDDQFGHHMMLLDAYDGEDVPDGTVLDCDGQSVMALRPLLEANELLGEISGRMVLNDGLAVRLKSGQRWAMQSHYVNWSDRELLVQDAINLGTVPVEEVEHWVGTWSFNTSVFELPPHEETQLTFTCPWPSDVSVLHMMGHMHDYGTAIRVTHDTPAGSTEVYALPAWDPAWQQQPRLVSYAAGELMPRAGDSFTPTCDPHTPPAASIGFPTGRCVAAGLAWPLDTPLHCDAGYP
ncbi:MAG: hypothetical protein ACK4YP_05090, partial [Myxococcota bacterium]